MAEPDEIDAQRRVADLFLCTDRLDNGLFTENEIQSRRYDSIAVRQNPHMYSFLDRDYWHLTPVNEKPFVIEAYERIRADMIALYEPMFERGALNILSVAAIAIDLESRAPALFERLFELNDSADGHLYVNVEVTYHDFAPIFTELRVLLDEAMRTVAYSFQEVQAREYRFRGPALSRTVTFDPNQLSLKSLNMLRLFSVV